MTKSVTYGPVGTSVAGVSSVAFSPAPLNFDADFMAIDNSKAGQVIYTDVTSPLGQEATLRIAQVARPNIYSGTSIEPAAMLPSKRGMDLVVEIKEVHKEVDSDDPTYLRLIPYRCAITLNLPVTEQCNATVVAHLLGRALAAFAQQGDDELTAGVNALLHGVVTKI